MSDLFPTLLEIYKLACTVGVSAVVLLGLFVWIEFKDECDAEAKAEKEHIARSGGI
jgi:hypothetical protein